MRLVVLVVEGGGAVLVDVRTPCSLHTQCAELTDAAKARPAALAVLVKSGLLDGIGAAVTSALSANVPVDKGLTGRKPC